MTRLAIEGGAPVRTTPLPHWPYFAEDERVAVDAVLRSGRVNYWTGDVARRFEEEFAAALGDPHAIALANGTVALELALWVLGVGPGDEVVVPARTFIATASAAAMRGAIPVCADVGRDNQNVTAETIEATITPRTRAVIVVHLVGWPCDMEPIQHLARERGLALVEDCAQAQGATYRGRPVGTFGDAATFSFCQDKIMTTGGEGGTLVLGDRDAHELAWSLKDHGKSPAAVAEAAASDGIEFQWLHERFGTNWRMTEMQAAIGRVALPKVPSWVETRRANAAVVDECIARHPGLRAPSPASHEGHAYYKYYAFVEPDRLAEGWTRSRIARALRAEGIPCFTGSCPEIYLERAFDGIRPVHRLPVARELGETSLMLLVHPTLSPQDLEDTCAAIDKVMEVAEE